MERFWNKSRNWATLILVVALLITLLVVVTKRDVAYGLVIIWACVGIAVNQSGHANIVRIAEIDAVIVAIALAASILVTLLKR